MSKKRKTKVVNKHFDTYTVDISRRGPYGNPFPIKRGCTREQSIGKHWDWLQQWIKNKIEIIYGKGRWSNKWVVEHLEDLRGKRIGCTCKPLSCHGDNYIKLLGE